MNCIKCGSELPEGAVYCHICGKKQVSESKVHRRTRPNGTGSVYRRGKTWEAAVVLGYRIVDGKARAVRQVKGGFSTKKEAMNYLPELRQQRPKNVPTIEDLWEQYQLGPYTKLSKSKQTAYRIAFNKMDSIRWQPVDLLTVADLDRLILDKCPTYYPAKDCRDLLSLLFQRAMADQFITVNLSKFMTLPDKEETEREAFTQEEIGKLWEDYAAGNWWTGYVLLMCYTGMMPGELLGAKKASIDWDRKEILGAGKKTKTRKETPIVLADCILPVLEDLCDHTQGEKLIAINKDRFYEVFHETHQRAGTRDLKPYSCRHTTATALALDKVAPSIIQKVMRHSKFSSSEGYIHIDTAPMLDAVNKISSGR